MGENHTIKIKEANPNKSEPGYISLAATALKLRQIPMFLHISARVWGIETYQNGRVLCKNRNKYAMKALVPDCTHIEGILKHFIQVSPCYICPLQIILHQFERDVAAWKRLGWPHAYSEPGG